MSQEDSTPYGFASEPDDIQTGTKIAGGDVKPLHAVVAIDDPGQSEAFQLSPESVRERADMVEEHTPEWDWFAVKLRGLADEAEAKEASLA